MYARGRKGPGDHGWLGGREKKIVHQSVEITLYCAIKSHAVGALFRLHEAASRGFIGLLTNSRENAFVAKMRAASRVSATTCTYTYVKARRLHARAQSRPGTTGRGKPNVENQKQHCKLLYDRVDKNKP